MLKKFQLWVRSADICSELPAAFFSSCMRPLCSSFVSCSILPSGPLAVPEVSLRLCSSSCHRHSAAALRKRIEPGLYLLEVDALCIHRSHIRQA